MKHILLIFVLISSCTVSKKLEEPAYSKSDIYINHENYSLVYNKENNQAQWVAYQLLKEELTPNFKRTNKFEEDAQVYCGTAANKDYYHSGYDKGHLAPAADMVWDKKAMEESFYFSNISPQLPGFNRGIWKRLETKVRKWANKFGEIYVVSGPVVTKEHSTIGENKVAVPAYFYKAVLVFNDSIKQSIGFIFPHKKCSGDLMDYAVSVDSIENFISADLFEALPNRIERKIEASFDNNNWIIESKNGSK